jgi:uncharacterized protein
MVYHSFITEKSGLQFLYDAHNHALMGMDKGNLNLPFDPEKMDLPVSSVRKADTPKTLKFLLGHACNYSCGYCVQKDIGNSEEKIKNSKTVGFIEKIRSSLDLKNVHRIELWGGETLLYWNDITALITEFDREGITWYIPTNGTLLSEKHADFFQTLKGKVNIGISHDGPAHETLRGPNFLERKAAVFKRLQDDGIEFSFNSVISVYNYDLFKINDYFASYLKKHNLKPVPLVFEVGRSYDKTLSKNSSLHIIHGEHLTKYKEILKNYLEEHRKKLFDPSYASDLLYTNLFHFGNGVVPYATTLKQQRPVSFKSSCGADLDDLLTVDLNGDIRTCQNAGADHVFGKVEQIKNAANKKLDLERSENFCKDCSVLRLCKSSCPIDINYDVFYANHLVEKVHYTEIQLSAFSVLFNEKVSQYEQ